MNPQITQILGYELNRWRIGVGDEAAAAAGFVHANCSDGDALVRFKCAL